MSDTLNNKKAKFFMENANTVFQFNFGKGTKVKGRLEYTDKGKVIEFVYKDAKGKLRTIEVTSDQFVAKPGYDVPMIMAVGQLTAVQQEALKEFSEQVDDRTEAKRAGRLKILGELFDEVSGNLQKTTNLIKQKQEQFNKIVADLVELEEKSKSRRAYKNKSVQENYSQSCC